ncbi:MAG: type II secretion system protein [Candidatus Kerfeldbacteria bacterium]|nr:type II secretion system protein [Candidatus Kerfeldbacteria bacterium]
MRKNTSSKGFTLIELLIVIGIIAVLAALTFVAVNPMKRFKQARDTERRTSVDAILNAILKYQVDNNGDLPTGVDATTTARLLGTATTSCVGCEAITTASTCLDLTSSLVNEYLDEMPVDPLSTTYTSAAKTGYYVKIDKIPSAGGGTSGRLTVGSCDPELTANKPMRSTR